MITRKLQFKLYEYFKQTYVNNLLKINKCVSNYVLTWLILSSIVKSLIQS